MPDSNDRLLEAIHESSIRMVSQLKPHRQKLRRSHRRDRRALPERNHHGHRDRDSELEEEFTDDASHEDDRHKDGQDGD